VNYSLANMFEEDDGSVVVEAMTIDVMTLDVAAVALAEVDVVTLGWCGR